MSNQLGYCVSDILQESGYNWVHKGRFDPPEISERPVFTHSFIAGSDLYGLDHKVDFILYHPRLHPDCLCIQCRWSNSGWKAEKKFPFEVLSIKQGEFDTIIILDGSGYTVAARNWLVAQAGKNRLLHVFNQGEFTRFASKGGI